MSADKGVECRKVSVLVFKERLFIRGRENIKQATRRTSKFK